MYKRESINDIDVKQFIITSLKKTHRTGIENLIIWMEQNGFFDAPCSSKYHLAKRGGLAEHSLNVYNTAFDLARNLPDMKLTITMIDSIILCSLLHDLGKAGQYGKPNYKEIPGETPQDPTSFETNKELLYVPHEVRSIAIASRFIELTEEEQHAILYHNGLYGELTSIKNSETELHMILHFADMWASRVIEREGQKIECIKSF